MADCNGLFPLCQLSHLVNFPLRQFPLSQFPFGQCWQSGNWQSGSWPSGNWQSGNKPLQSAINIFYKVGIHEVGRFTIFYTSNHCYRSVNILVHQSNLLSGARDDKTVWCCQLSQTHKRLTSGESGLLSSKHWVKWSKLPCSLCNS